VTFSKDRLRVAAFLLSAALAGSSAFAQRTATPPAPVPPAAPVATDAFGRTTPRRAVLGFLAAARKGDLQLARHYLDTPLPAERGEELARQLFVVLDRRLAPRLTQVSDEAEGSRANPLAPNDEAVGQIQASGETIPIVLHRVKRPEGLVWLFSPATLEAVPGVYEEVTAGATSWLPDFIERRIDNVRLVEWLAILVGLPALYFLIGRRLFARVDGPLKHALPAPVRLLLLSFAGRWLISRLPLSLLARQALTNLATVFSIVGIAWVMVLLNGLVERHVARRLPPADASAAVSLLRVGRRIVDVFIVVAALLANLRLFGVDPTPLLAGLGVGGIAVALAAQKTLENVIAGASLIFDKAVRVGDFLKVGVLEGTVEHIGLRSTRIRTLDRTIVSVPNGQIATMSLETMSARDKFWFHPVVGLRYETTPDQMRSVLDRIRALLMRHAAIDGPSVRVRFLRLGAFSLDVEVFAYIYGRDWPHFLEIQEGLLLEITDIVAAAGTGIAFPSQTMYLSGESSTTPQLRNSAIPK